MVSKYSYFHAFNAWFPPALCAMCTKVGSKSLSLSWFEYSARSHLLRHGRCVTLNNYLDGGEEDVLS